jgi:hypothetical protein
MTDEIVVEIASAFAEPLIREMEVVVVVLFGGCFC